MDLQFLLALPDSVTCAILQDWLCLKSLVALDSAFCNKLERGQLLTLLRSNAFTLQKHSANSSNMLNENYVPWIIDRMITSQHFDVVDCTTDDNEVKYIPQVVKYIQQCGAKITSLALRNEDDVDELLDAIISHCHSLTYLLVNMSISDKHLRDLILANSNLVEMHILNFNNEIEGEELLFSNIQLPNLRTLTCCTLSSTALVDVLQVSMGNLTKLSVDTDEEEVDLSAIAEYCPLLHSLGFSGLDIGDPTLIQIARACPHIVNLDLKGTDITDEGMLAVVTLLPGLQSLDIVNCSELTSASLEHIYTHCAKTLHSLYLNSSAVGPDFDYDALNNLFSLCKQLHTLKWDQYDMNVPIYIFPETITNITTLLLQGDAANCENLLQISRYCKQLVTLSISYSEFVVSAVDLTAVVVGCPALRSLCYTGGLCDDNGEYVDRAAHVQQWRCINPQLTMPPHTKLSILDMSV